MEGMDAPLQCITFSGQQSQAITPHKSLENLINFQFKTHNVYKLHRKAGVGIHFLLVPILNVDGMFINIFPVTTSSIS